MPQLGEPLKQPCSKWENSPALSHAALGMSAGVELELRSSFWSSVSDREGKIFRKLKASKPAVPNLFGTRDWFRGRQFFHGWRGGMVRR